MVGVTATAPRSPEAARTVSMISGAAWFRSAGGQAAGRAAAGGEDVQVHGCSANTRRSWHDEAALAPLTYSPQDNAEAWPPQLLHLLLPEGPQRKLQGGSFIGIGAFDE